MRDPRHGRFVARTIASLVLGKSHDGAHAYASGQRWADAPRVKAAISSLLDADPSVWREAAIDLLPLIKEQSVIDRLSGVRHIALECRTITQTTRTSAAFVAPGAPIAVSKGSFSATT